MKNLSFLCVAAGLVFIGASPASSAELKIFGSRVTKMIVEAVGPQFERATGHHLVVVADVAAVMKRRIEAGEPFDLAVLVNFQADELVKQGKLLGDTRSNIMKVGIGIAVRRGAPIPDIGTVETFKQTLLAAKSITYLKEGASTIYLDRLFARIGIANELRPKTVKPERESVSEAVASGDVELALIVIPNILSVPGRTTRWTPSRGNPVLHRLHGGGCGEFAEPAGGARSHCVPEIAGGHRGDQGQRHESGLALTSSANPRERADPCATSPAHRRLAFWLDVIGADPR